ncbi:hypothetical protein C1I98_16540 [Spongiactinospora gelatinilytica]|uniref:Uncharacterized protein n=1 Tax=Spongiactinospora gelatinilytica TaxID=2666298 RepID=A0A2W2HEY7_9ACTN|nr:hypothetical protein [Spongiactinospora gelatinilytica]PZG44757.1 hypothetical protein C1I98_16540 [Spongiactinospora gelatinilytica]
MARTSPHHVGDPEDVLDRMAGAPVPGGTAVVIEWSHEKFDAPTATWCLDRLPEAAEPGWPHRHRDRWRASGGSWETYGAAWAREEGLCGGQDIVRALRRRFTTPLSEEGPYFFSDPDGVTAADEQAAIDAGRIRATGIRYVGRGPA